MGTAFRDSQDRELHLDTLYRDGRCFLVAGGPSAKKLPLEKLAQRGVLIASFNNCAGVLPDVSGVPIRPHIWHHSDKPVKFHEALWNDPAILKIVPVTMWNKHENKDHKDWCIYHRDENGTFKPTGKFPCELPGVIGYQRNHNFDPATWLTADSVNQGNDKKHALALDKHDKPIPGMKPNGWPRVINTMFSILGVLYRLGIRTIYLVGCDFRMSVDRPYGFMQAKHQGGVVECNGHFRDMNKCYTALAPYFDKAGLSVFNCYEYSGLTAFPFRSFEDCLHDVTSIASFPTRLDTFGWYEVDDLVSK